MIVLLAGLPGTGKSTLARELAARTAGRVISKDDIRHAIFSPDEIRYSSQQDDFCLQVMLALAGQLLEAKPGRFIFLDGRTFSRRYQIENVLTAAASLRHPWRILEFACSDQAAKRRLEEKGEHPAENRNYLLYLEVKARFEAITLPHAIIDTEQSLEACIQTALAALR